MLLITLPLNSKLYIHFTILVLRRMIFTCRQTYNHMLLILSTLRSIYFTRRYKSNISMSFFNLNLINNKFANMSKEYARALLAQTTILRITHSKAALLFLLYVSYLFYKTIWLNANYFDFKDVPTNAVCLHLPSCTKKNLCFFPIDEDFKITIKIVFPKEQ